MLDKLIHQEIEHQLEVGIYIYYILIKIYFIKINKILYLGYVFDIDGTSLPHETIECLRTWPSEDDFKEAIRIGYSEAISFAKYLQIDNQTALSMQQFIRHIEHLSDDQNNLEIVDDDDDNDQYQNLAGIKN